MKTIVLFFLFIPLLFSSCSEKASVEIAGSSTIMPVVSVAAEQYRKMHPELNIIVNAGGSGVGINQVAEGKVDIGMSSRELSEEERKKHPGLNMISIGRDAVVPVVSSEVYEEGIRALSAIQLRSIYLGKVRNWKELGGPDREILVIDKEKSRGTRHVFMRVVMNNRNAEAPGADLVLGSNNEEQTAIVQSNAAIGMLSHAWLNKDVKGLDIITKDSTISPEAKQIKSGAYPFTRDLYVITKGEPKQDIKVFIDYLLSREVRQIIKEKGYVPVAE